MNMKIEISVPTSRKIQLSDITRPVSAAVGESGISEGICVVYCPHTTGGLVINENADPDVASDLERAFDELVPNIHYHHNEGNSPAHFLASVTRPSLQIIVENGHLQLGRWQGIALADFDGPKERTVMIEVIKK